MAKQAMQSGTNVAQNMIDMHKQMADTETLEENTGIYAAIAGTTDSKAIEINDQMAYIEQVGVMMGAIETAVTPRESYAGKDKMQLHAKIEKAWKSQYLNDAIANIYPVFLLKDHLNTNALEIDAESTKSTPGMGSKMRVKNYNP